MTKFCEIYIKITKTLLDEFGISENEVNLESRLDGEVFDDRLEVFELVLYVENEFQISIDENMITEKTTLGDLVKIVESSL